MYHESEPCTAANYLTSELIRIPTEVARLPGPSAQELQSSGEEPRAGPARNWRGVASIPSATRNNLLRHGFVWASSPISASTRW